MSPRAIVVAVFCMLTVGALAASMWWPADYVADTGGSRIRTIERRTPIHDERMVAGAEYDTIAASWRERHRLAGIAQNCRKYGACQ